MMCKQLLRGIGRGIMTTTLRVFSTDACCCFSYHRLLASWICGCGMQGCRQLTVFVFAEDLFIHSGKDEKRMEDGQKKSRSFSFHCKIFLALWFTASDSTVRISRSYFQTLTQSQIQRCKTDWETFLKNLSAFPPCCQIENFWLNHLGLGEAKAFATLFF